MAAEHHGAFGEDTFGRQAEKIARFFGTPQYILGQTIVVLAWIAINAVAVSLQWDPYPFILLNLAFSTQAAYAAPLICSRRRGRPTGTSSLKIGRSTVTTKWSASRRSASPRSRRRRTS
jgi:hypothetical protein